GALRRRTHAEAREGRRSARPRSGARSRSEGDREICSVSRVRDSGRNMMVLGHKLHGNGPEGAYLYNDWLADSSSWLPTLPYLDTKTFTYCLTDLRGYGRSMDQKGEYNEREAAADTVALADHLGLRKFQLVGLSMTGMVVERLAVDVPDRIKSVVAVGPVSAAGIKMS